MYNFALSGTTSNFVSGAPITLASSSTNTISPTACVSYSSPAGRTYTSSGTYKDTLVNSVGCDSIITINLSIGASPITVLNASSITSSSASLNWNSIVGAGGYEYVLDNNSSNPTGSGTATTSTTYAASGLSPFTTYYMHVRSTCGGNYSTWTTISFTTRCAVPTATITPIGSTTICSKDSVVLNANAGTGFTYQWQLGGTDIAGATSASYTAKTTGNYTVVLTMDTCTSTSAITAVTVHPSPDTTVTTNPMSAGICQGKTMTLSVASVTGGTYKWFNGSTLITGATSASYTTGTGGNYRVYISDGICGDTSGVHSVAILPAPTSTITTSRPRTFCQGDSVVLNGPAPAPGISYQWILNGNPISGAVSNTYTAYAAGAYRLALNNGSCTDTSAIATVIVLAKPTPTITPSGATSFCIGSSVVLSATTGTGFTYKWLLNNLLITGATSATYTASVAGQYRVIVTNANGCFDTSVATTITTYTKPSTTLTALSGLTFCDGGSVTLQTTSVSGYTYVWYRNGVVISGATAATYVATTSGVYYVSVTNGTCNSVTNTLTVVVNSNPTATVTASGPVTFCVGSSVILSANTGTGLTYVWRNGGTPIGVTSSSYTATTAGVYDVIVSNGNCQTISNSITVLTSTMAAPTITAASPTAFCQGGSVALSTAVDPTFTYQWLKDNIAISGANTSNYTATTAGSYTVIVANGYCTITSSPVSVSVNSAPPAMIIPAGATTFCEGMSTTLNATINNPAYSYSWLLNSNVITGANSSSYIATQSGDYSVIVSNTNCSATSSPLTIQVIASPVTPTITANANVLSTVDPYTTYQWYWNGSLIPGATSRSYTATANGNYAVVVTNYAGCAGGSNIYILTGVGVSTIYGTKQVTLYPNPTTEIVYIVAALPVNISVRDMSGKEIIRLTDTKEVNLAKYADGIYFLHISDLDGTPIKNEKVLKQTK